MQALHPNLVNGIISCLQKIFGENAYADAAVWQILKSNKKWGARDRRFIAEAVYDIVRWWRLLWVASGYKPSLENNSLAEILRFYIAKPVKEYQKNSGNRAIRESIPDWLDDLGFHELGGRWDEEIAALNTEAPVFLRANSLKCTREKLKAALAREGVSAEPLTSSDVYGISLLTTHHSPLTSLNETLRLLQRKNVYLTESFKQGLFEVQDASSQMVSHFMKVKPGMRVVDACAGGGGKSLHLAALMENKGRITALDKSEKKLAELRLRARRAGVSIIETKQIGSTKVIKRLAESADRVLLDVPCSGLGVLRRNPDAKWKLSLDKIDSIRKEQMQILNQYCRMVKPGGMLIYSTCSILPSENELQVKKFLEEHPDLFILADEKKISPAQSGWDGFYMAALKRTTHHHQGFLREAGAGEGSVSGGYPGSVSAVPANAS